MAIILFCLNLAHAGLFDFCRGRLDPYQFEGHGQKWLEKAIIELEIKQRWRKLDREEDELLEVLLKEKAKRRLIDEVLKGG